MKATHTPSMPLLALDKLTSLIITLQDVQLKYESALETVTEKSLKQGLKTLAEACCQYGNDLNYHIQTTGIHPDNLHLFIQKKLTDDTCLLSEYDPQDDIWVYNARNEAKILKSYRQVLNDSVLNENLRKMIRSQFNGLLFIFLQIKLLK